MLYRTHTRYGQLFGVVGMIYAFSMSLIPALSLSYTGGMNILIMILTYLAYRSSLFGAEFPDIDSPGSVPARKWVIIRRIFSAFDIKHRGKFSHDYISLAVFFGAFYLLGKLASMFLYANDGLTIMVTIGLLFFIGKDIGNVTAFNVIKKRKGVKSTLLDRKRSRLSFLIGFVFTVVMFFVLKIFGYVPDGSMGGSIQSSAFVYRVYGVFVVFTWIGAYSHLFADMMTNEGVNIFGKRISPARVVLAFNKIPFLPPLVSAALGYFSGGEVGAVAGLIIGVVIYFMISKTGLRTSSKYEDMCRMIVTYLLVPSVLILVYVMSGGNINTILNLF